MHMTGLWLCLQSRWKWYGLALDSVQQAKSRIMIDGSVFGRLNETHVNLQRHSIQSVANHNTSREAGDWVQINRTETRQMVLAGRHSARYRLVAAVVTTNTPSTPFLCPSSIHQVVLVVAASHIATDSQFPKLYVRTLATFTHDVASSL